MHIPIFIYKPEEVEVKTSYPVNNQKKQSSKRTKQTKVYYDSNIGTYCVLCKSTNTVYIGQSKNIPSRIKAHKSALRRGDYSNNTKGLQKMQRDYKKYGIHDFVFTQIAQCEEDELYDVETEAIKQYLENGFEIYNYFVNTKVSGMFCPPYLVDVMTRAIKLIEDGRLSLTEFEKAVDKLENPWY